MFPLFSVAIDLIHFKFVGNKDMHDILDEFKFGPDQRLRAQTTELSALECLEILPYTYNGENGVSTCR